jgi:hypothetical protein
MSLVLNWRRSCQYRGQSLEGLLKWCRLDDYEEHRRRDAVTASTSGA